MLLHLLAGPAVESRLTLFRHLVERIQPAPVDWLLVLESPLGCELADLQLPPTVRWVLAPEVMGESAERFWQREQDRILDPYEPGHVLWWVSPKRETLPFDTSQLPEGVTLDSFTLSLEAKWLQHVLDHGGGSRLLEQADFIIAGDDHQQVGSLLEWSLIPKRVFDASLGEKLVCGFFGIPPAPDQGCECFNWAAYKPRDMVEEAPLRGLLNNPPAGMVRLHGVLNLSDAKAVAIHFFQGRINWSRLAQGVKPERSKLWIMSDSPESLRTIQTKLERCEVRI